MKVFIIMIVALFGFCVIAQADVSRWQKLNHLVPGPKCSMEEDDQGELQITEWKDARPRPTDIVIDSVTEAEVNDSEEVTKKERKFNKGIVKAMGLTMKYFMNEIMAGRTNPITNSELKTKFKSYLP